MSNNDVVLLDSIEKNEVVKGGVRTVRFTLGGDPHKQAIVAAVDQAYREARTGDVDLDVLVGQKVTLLMSGTGTYGATSIYLREGTILTHQGGYAILPKGKRSNGFILKADSILDALVGYGQGGRLASRVDLILDRLPTLAKVTRDDLLALPDDAVDDDGNTSAVTLAAFGTLPWFDGATIAGAIWLCVGYDRENDIVDCTLLVPEGHDACSEHGSIYGADLLRRGGKIEGFLPMSFRDSLELCDASYGAALACVRPGRVIA